MIFSLSSTGRARRGGGFVLDVSAMLKSIAIFCDYGDR